LGSNSVASKKYALKYKGYKDYTPPAYTPLVGCIYQAKTAAKINVVGMLMQYGEAKSTIKNKRGVSYTVLSNTLKVVLAL
jgi:hypothetical protein